MRNPGQPMIRIEATTRVTEIVGAGEETRKKRKNRILAIVANGFPSPPKHIFELITLLSKSVVNLKHVSEIIGSDADLTAQILRLANSIFEHPRSGMDVPEAVVLLGAERLRMLIVSCAVMKFAGRHLPAETIQKFWHHSFLTASVSEEIAQRAEYPAVEMSSLGGLLHDIGLLPLLIATHEEANSGILPNDWEENLGLQQAHFGVDHCEVGRWIGIAWDFSPSLIDVLEHHHDPSNATEDPLLTEIVAAGDYHCIRQALATDQGSAAHWRVEDDDSAFLKMRPSRICEQDRAVRSQFLEDAELDIPFPQFGLS